MCIVLLADIEGKAQDVNYMMYSNTSLSINPAIISSSDNFKVSANYRDKTYIHEVNSKSAYFMLSRPLYKNNKRFGGFGFSILSDKGGNTNLFSYEGISGAYAHEVQLNSRSRLSLGLQATYLMKKIESQQFSTGNQWVDGVGYDPTIVSGEEFESLSSGNLNLSSGLFWYIPNDDRSIKFYLGFSMYNLNKPKYSFFGIDQAEPVRYVASSGYELYSEEKFSITPQVLYDYNYYEHNFTVGARWKYRFSIDKSKKLFTSGSIELITDYQSNEGMALGVQINQPSFSVGIGYGFADNFASDYTPEKGLVEVSFAYKKSLFKIPAKKTVESNVAYTSEGMREFDFEKHKKKVVTKEEVKEIKKEIKRETDKEIKFKLEKDFQFCFNEAELNDDAKAYINDIVILLSENEMLRIEIIGHTDNVGTREANQRISEERAEVVRNYLIEKGVDAERITTNGMADKQPLFENDSKENRSRNRRVEFVIYY